MSLNEDVLSQIFKELKDDKNSLYSCLLVNRLWCAITVPILWRNPNYHYYFLPSVLIYRTSDSFHYYSKLRKLFNTILLHLSEESRDILKNQGINIDEKYKHPLFNYINYWKYLNFLFMRDLIYDSEIDKSKVSIIKNEILKLFINKNTNFVHLTILNHLTCVPIYLDYQPHLISGFECCFSKLESIHCNNYFNQDILKELAKICKSIKELKFDIICQNTTSGIIELIEVQKNLIDVNFSKFVRFNNRLFIRYLEESLIKHADTIQCLKINRIPILKLKKFLSYFVSLLRLEIVFNKFWDDSDKENLTLPILKALKVRLVSPNIVINIIENTKGHLSEICLDYDDYHDNGIEKIIQAIYQNCSNLQYLKLSCEIGSLISELENLLINCQFLNELVIDTLNNFDMDKLFILLTKFSPITLFKFEFIDYRINLDDIKLFFDNWKDRNPMLLKLMYQRISISNEIEQQLEDLVEEYKAKGIIKKYFFGYYSV
ncbi:hypothetical protein RhiirA1_464550 [Rhizophagus irregularis]|uniref:F-box domain-containing protein n=1 Tax=Rhizophagus irregularis TaxID=588596 RepID=A0A2N0RHT5_9GLOM|nr:hypothetical protein RhiirA1_464550 [Rhizophagus irregularis]